MWASIEVRPSTTMGFRMAQKVSITMTDDLDGSEATETVAFSLDGTAYELDLNARNAASMRKAFDKYVGAARKAGRGAARAGSGRSRRRSSSDVDPKAVRAWAAS